MGDRPPSNLLTLAVLSCLAERPMHPYEISQTLRQRGTDHAIKLNFGALYGVVDKLAAAGLIEAVETVRQGRRPERTVYAITDDGLAKRDGWLSELIRTPTREFASFEAGLALVGGLAPDVVAALLDERVVRLRVEIASVEESERIAQEMHVPEVFTVEASFRLAQRRAELAFVGELRDKIREGTLGGLAGWRRLHELLDEGLTMEEITADPIRHLGEDGRGFVVDSG
jgi:DNA-binding PadR family transcriptional regulator